MKGDRMRETNGVFSSYFRHAHGRHFSGFDVVPNCAHNCVREGL